MNKSKLESLFAELREKCDAADASGDAAVVAEVSERARRVCSSVPVPVLMDLFPKVRFR